MAYLQVDWSTPPPPANRGFISGREIFWVWEVGLRLLELCIGRKGPFSSSWLALWPMFTNVDLAQRHTEGTMLSDVRYRVVYYSLLPVQ